MKKMVTTLPLPGNSGLANRSAVFITVRGHWCQTSIDERLVLQFSKEAPVFVNAGCGKLSALQLGASVDLPSSRCYYGLKFCIKVVSE
jgi:hypothetical protein